MKIIPRHLLQFALLSAVACWLAWHTEPSPTAAQGGIKIESGKPKVTPAPKPEPRVTTPKPPVVRKPAPTSIRRTAPDIEMVSINGGSFLMGSPANEAGRSDDEGPQHRVTVLSFAIGKYEITQAQWRAVMATNPANFKGDDLPVEQVSWNDAKEFCRKLSQMTGKAYRLPTEAEWEYAARAGTTGPYAGELDVMAWYDKNAGGKTHPVGQKKPNAFGLYDMHGNVWEWCEDIWHGNYNGAPTDGSSWLSGGDSSHRVLRGGAWYGNSGLCRSANRNSLTLGDRNDDLGFRLVVGSRTP